MPPASTEVALAGPDGARAATLLASAKAEGTALLARLTEQALTRLLAMPDPLAHPILFDDAELQQIAESLASTIATADLLGRSRIRQHAVLAEARHKFAEGDFPDSQPTDPYHVFPEPIPVLPPAQAVNYFQRLVPALGTDPFRYGPLLERHAFTLAVATDQVLLDKVKSAIKERLLGVAEIGTATADVQDLLDAAGVSVRSPAYAETVFRTNMMDAYNTGQVAELQDPVMQEFFPVWQYLGIRDGRQGADHEPRFNKYYPASAAFADVRGPRVFNCRCGPNPVNKYDWSDLVSKGVRAETSWPPIII